MPSMPTHRYRPFPTVALPDRRWPSRTLERAPRWCAVDLRDGNQALAEPMGPERKLRFFELLVRLGFKEIEVGFPSSSQPDFDFVRSLIERNLIPDDVTIQVLTPARDELIERTFEAVAGARRAIFHLYNSTSELQRRVVFGLDEAGITAIAQGGVRAIAQRARRHPETEIVLQYSPESFTGTELDFARDICAAVLDAWEPTPAKKMILNLPATVEHTSPNVYADALEWMARTLPRRDCYVLSAHPHNDRGTAVAAAELAMMAGAERVEGTLFGNGERTGNVCLVTLALNLFAQGVDPELDLSNLPEVVRTVEHCNRLPVHARHPYGGELVFTAFSGTHQDAINKGFAALERTDGSRWEVPYLPVDPRDLGRTYEAVVRINSQSGKGGLAYVMGNDFGFDLPRGLQVEFSGLVQKLTEAREGELLPDEIYAAFGREYFESRSPLDLLEYRISDDGKGRVSLEVTVANQGGVRTLRGAGNGPIDALVTALREELVVDLGVRDFHEDALGSGADATAVAYVELVTAERTHWGVGMDRSTVTASLRAVLCGFNRAVRLDGLRCSGLRGNVAPATGRPTTDEGEYAELAV
ncbi:MAG: 2-isopropylmalate synthase [Vulcanimicrobiaceae bacterium]